MAQIGKYGKRTGSVGATVRKGTVTVRSDGSRDTTWSKPREMEMRPISSDNFFDSGATLHTVKRESTRKIPQNESERTPAERQHLADLARREKIASTPTMRLNKRTTPVRSTKQAGVGYSPKLSRGVQRVVGKKGR